jgi:ABC-type phosphate transport system substrate-binding protein
MMNWKELGKKRSGLIEVLSWHSSEGTQENFENNSFWKTGVLFEIRTQNFPLEV